MVSDLVAGRSEIIRYVPEHMLLVHFLVRPEVRNLQMRLVQTGLGGWFWASDLHNDVTDVERLGLFHWKAQGALRVCYHFFVNLVRAAYYLLH